MARKQHELERLRDEVREAEDQTDGMTRQKDDTMKVHQKLSLTANFSKMINDKSMHALVGYW